MFRLWFEARHFSEMNCEEMYSRTFENLDDVVRETREELSTYRDILEISDRVKKSEPKMDFSKDKRDWPKSVETFPKKTEATSIPGQLFSLKRSLAQLVRKMI